MRGARRRNDHRSQRCDRDLVASHRMATATVCHWGQCGLSDVAFRTLAQDRRGIRITDPVLLSGHGRAVLESAEFAPCIALPSRTPGAGNGPRRRRRPATLPCVFNALTRIRGRPGRGSAAGLQPSPWCLRSCCRGRRCAQVDACGSDLRTDAAPREDTVGVGRHKPVPACRKCVECVPGAIFPKRRVPQVEHPAAVMAAAVGAVLP